MVSDDRQRRHQVEALNEEVSTAQQSLALSILWPISRLCQIAVPPGQWGDSPNRFAELSLNVDKTRNGGLTCTCIRRRGDKWNEAPKDKFMVRPEPFHLNSKIESEAEKDEKSMVEKQYAR